MELINFVLCSINNLNYCLFLLTFNLNKKCNGILSKEFFRSNTFGFAYSCLFSASAAYMFDIFTRIET